MTFLRQEQQPSYPCTCWHGSLSSLPLQKMKMIRSTPLALCTYTRQVDCPLCSGANRRRQSFTWGSTVLKYLPSSKFTHLKFLIFSFHINQHACKGENLHQMKILCAGSPPPPLPHPQVKSCVKLQCVSQLMWLFSSKGLSTLIVYTGGSPFLINPSLKKKLGLKLVQAVCKGESGVLN